MKCFGFEALLLCLCLASVWFCWRDRGRGWGSVGWVGESTSAGEYQCGRKRLHEKTVWTTDNEIENTVLRFFYLHLYHTASRSFIFLATTIHSTKQKLCTFLYTMMAFIFTGFRISDIVQRWPLKFSWSRFQVRFFPWTTLKSEKITKPQMEK